MPNILKTYGLGFTSDLGVVWDIRISDIAPAAYITDENLDRQFTANDFRLNYKGTGDDIFDAVKSSSLKFPVVITGNIDRNKIDDIFDTNFDVSWYVSLWKDEELYWWGYLSPMTSNKPNQYFPYDYNLEALDSLALLKEQKIFTKANTYDVLLPFWGVTIPMPKHRFGGDRTQNATPALSVHIWPKNEPTVIELIYSLLFDLDTDVSSKLKHVMFWETGQNTAPNTGPLAHTTTNVWWYLYNDVQVNPTLGFPIDQIESVTAHDILQKICKLLCVRIFQKGGDYWVVQPEIYDTGLGQDLYTHEKGPVATKGNHPVFESSAVLLSTEYLTTITSKPTGPYIIEGSHWGKLPSTNTTSLTYPDAVFNTGGQIKLELGITTTTSNLSDLSVRENEMTTVVPRQWWKFAQKVGQPGSVERLFDRDSGAFLTRREATYNTQVRARAEFRNKGRNEFSGTIYTDDYDFLNGIVYDGSTYIPHTFQLSGRADEFKCRWLEARPETGGIGEMKAKDLDP